MTKKDFELIAAALRADKPDPKDRNFVDRLDAWSIVVAGMGAELATTNPQFNREKFLTACGVAS